MTELCNKTVLNNGVRIITEQISTFKSIACGIWVISGSRDETENQKGISHFIEHMLFKGTQKRSAEEISKVIESHGGIINAFTSKEYTCFYTKMLDEYYKLSIDVLTDMFFNSIFATEEIAKEKNVVLEEINMYEDNPQELIIDFFIETLIGKNSLGFSTLGTKEAVQNIKREDILNFIKTNYIPKKIIFVAVGNIKHNQLVDDLKETFSYLPSQDKIIKKVNIEKTSTIGIKEKDTEQIHLCLGMETYPITHPDRYTLALLNIILGGGMSSRLFQEIREKRGLVYAIYSFIESFSDSGLFGVYAGAKPENTEQVIDIILLELKKIKQEGIKDEILNQAKNQLKGQIILNLESSNTRMLKLASTETYFNKIFSIDEILKKIDMVKKEDITRISEELIKTSSLVLTLIGKDVDKFEGLKIEV